MSEEHEGKPAIDAGAASAALLRGEWPDLYALLGAAPTADAATLRKRIRESYVEATTNADHRNIARRIHFQTMAEQVLPQCHRILLDEKTRAAYDEQSRLHREGASGAREYASFVANTLGDEKTSRDQNDSMILGSAAPTPQDAHDAEMQTARAMLESLSGGARRGETRPGAENEAPQNELSSRATETETPPEQAQNDAIDSRLNARIAPPEPDADLASVAASPPTETENAVSPAQKNTSTQSDASTQSDTSTPPNATRDRRERRNENPVAAASDDSLDDDSMIPATRADAPQNDLASTRNASLSAENAASSAETEASERAAAEAKRAADVRLKNEISARRNARRGVGGEVSTASTRGPETPRESGATPNITPAAAAFNAAENAGANAAQSQDFTVAPEYRSEKIGVDVTQLPTMAPTETLPTFELPTASTRTSDEASGASGSGATPDSIARDFADAPADTVAARTIFAPRVSLGENEHSRRAAGAKTPAKRVLSSAVRTSLIVLISGIATLIIFRPGQNVAPVLAPLNITYASELSPFLQRAESAFEASPEGEGVDVNLSPVDARDAMSALLDAKTNLPDAWIPSEALWSDRYNKVAGKSGRAPIRVARPLALSPLVLLARGDQAGALRRKFPDHKIASWQALQAAVQSSAAGHFGLSDPIRSASGSIARLFMAQEWCAKNGVECNEKTLADPRLWKWLQGFENAVPSYGKLTGDMAKALALGTADRYWWALVYESDAISWMKQKKDLEVFYLPVSNFADHPFCRLSDGAGGKRDEFEKFLRAPDMQKVLLESGFRPADAELSSGGKSNPFNSADLKKRGLKIKGFRIDDRINYRLLNALNAQWAKRYKS